MFGVLPRASDANAVSVYLGRISPARREIDQHLQRPPFCPRGQGLAALLPGCTLGRPSSAPAALCGRPPRGAQAPVPWVHTESLPFSSRSRRCRSPGRSSSAMYWGLRRANTSSSGQVCPWGAAALLRAGPRSGSQMPLLPRQNGACGPSGTSPPRTLVVPSTKSSFSRCLPKWNTRFAPEMTRTCAMRHPRLAVANDANRLVRRHESLLDNTVCGRQRLAKGGLDVRNGIRYDHAVVERHQALLGHQAVPPDDPEKRSAKENDSANMSCPPPISRSIPHRE